MLGPMRLRSLSETDPTLPSFSHSQTRCARAVPHATADATVSFRDQPTVVGGNLSHARLAVAHAFEGPATRVDRPVYYRPTRSVPPVSLPPRASSRRALRPHRISVVAVCVISLLCGIAAGHLSREALGTAHAAAAAPVRLTRHAEVSREGLETIPTARAATRERTTATTARLATSKRRLPTTPPRPAFDAMFEELEPTFRVTP
jgi:hypothetical protein